MAKKKHHKKQNFKYAQAANATGSTLTAAKPGVENAQAARNVVKAVVSTADLSAANLMHVRKDVSRVAVLAVSFVVAEILLWVLFNHTSLGTTVYHLVSL